MEIRPAVSRLEFERMTTHELRATFLVERLFTPGTIDLVYWESDRTVIGSAVPLGIPLKLEADRELAADFFCERRELGVINIGGPGAITVDGARHALAGLGCLYICRGSREIVFASDADAQPARFYLVSYPAHVAHSTKGASPAQANQLQLGAPETANKRSIFQYIHEAGIPSCQLVMGFTRLESGSVWNTMPPHTHGRRSEVYLYFDLPDSDAVFHFMGPGGATRNLVVHSGQAVLSPIWSIHSGCGTRNYSFIWAMGGENQRFTDMDGISIADLR
jgi:4-deoxy-L-threo-5-hexosulose-uronate ketol-isomerase